MKYNFSTAQEEAQFIKEQQEARRKHKEEQEKYSASLLKLIKEWHELTGYNQIVDMLGIRNKRKVAEYLSEKLKMKLNEHGVGNYIYINFQEKTISILTRKEADSDWEGKNVDGVLNGQYPLMNY